MTKFPVKQWKELSDILARIDWEDVPSEAIAITLITEGNDFKHSWIGLNNYFSASPKHVLTFLIVGVSISAYRHVRFIADLGDHEV